MTILRSLLTVTLVLASLNVAQRGSAQQTAPSLDQGKKEGEVDWYGTLTGGAIVGNLIKTFESKFPGIKVKYLRLGGASFVERIRSEARAGKNFWDVVTSEYIQFFELSKHVTLARYARAFGFGDAKDLEMPGVQDKSLVERQQEYWVERGWALGCRWRRHKPKARSGNQS
jgi:ABC-type glycerol-3-phosphate transport system substrate-binding protein